MELFKLFGTVAINTNDAQNSLDGVASDAEGTENRMSSAFAKIGMAIATYFTVDKIIDFGKQCINAASNVEEMQNKFDVVFQGMTDSVESWADEFASAIGRNSNTIKGYLADNQNMFVGMGMTREQSAGLSENLVSLALDLASFNNLNETDAVNAMSKALMGESEAAKTLGAVLNDNTLALAQEALGYEGKFADLTEAEKMEVRYQAILMQSQDAVGDCVRSLDSYKGRTIQLNSAKEKLQETIGSMLLPTITKFVAGLTEVVSWLQSAVEWTQQHQDAARTIAIAIGTLTVAIVAYNIAQNALAIATAIATAATTAFGAVMAFVTSPVTLVVLAIGALIAIIVYLVKHWDEVKAKAKEVAQVVAEKFEEMKAKVQEKVASIVANVTSKFESIKSTIQSKLNTAKATVENIFNSIKNGITDKINAAKDAVKNAIDKIKSFLDFEFNLPHMPLPHFSVTPSGWVIGDLLKGVIPTLGIQWYAKGGILTEPTIFGMNGNNAMVGGEAGAEAVAPIDVLQGYVAEAVAGQNASVVEALDRILNAVKSLDDSFGTNMREALDGTSLSINNREFGRMVRQVI